MQMPIENERQQNLSLMLDELGFDEQSPFNFSRTSLDQSNQQTFKSPNPKINFLNNAKSPTNLLKSGLKSPKFFDRQAQFKSSNIKSIEKTQITLPQKHTQQIEFKIKSLKSYNQRSQSKAFIQIKDIKTELIKKIQSNQQQINKAKQQTTFVRKQLNKQEQNKYCKKQQKQQCKVNLDKTKPIFVSPFQQIFPAQQIKKFDSNKTVYISPQINSRKRVHSIVQQRKDEESEMRERMYLQRKQQNYNAISQWLTDQLYYRSTYAHFYQDFLARIDTQITHCISNFKIHLNRIDLIVRKLQKINLPIPLPQNSLVKSIYLNCSVVLSAFRQQESIKIEKRKHLFTKLYVEKMEREKCLVQGQQELLGNRKKIHRGRNLGSKVMEEIQSSTLILQQEYAKEYSSQKDVNYIHCVYYAQQILLRHIKHQQLQMRKVAESVKEYYYNAQQLLKNMQLINNKYSTQVSLQSLDIASLLKQHKIQESIETFEANFFPKPFDSHLLVAKQFEVDCVEYQKQGYIREETKLILTIDNYLHIYLNKKEMYSVPLVSIKLCKKQLQYKCNKNCIVDLFKKRKGSLIQHLWEGSIQMQFKITFRKKDQQDQFVQFIRSAMI